MYAVEPEATLLFGVYAVSLPTWMEAKGSKKDGVVSSSVPPYMTAVWKKMRTKASPRGARSRPSGTPSRSVSARVGSVLKPFGSETIVEPDQDHPFVSMVSEIPSPSVSAFHGFV